MSAPSTSSGAPGAVCAEDVAHHVPVQVFDTHRQQYAKTPNAPGLTLLNASPRLRVRLRHSFTRTCNGQFFGWRALASVFLRYGLIGWRRYRTAAAWAGCFAFGAERSRASRLRPPFRW